ncbi:hypothetical protein WH50_18365 [Pokkaliibacter plantistimulans]|uniref:N-acetylmuramoyl-L-alanine amidase n=1 Tax=Pokkaliibacter plantistimulans TaxID=1635171 RepID=A0ABX5LWB3_9GAMM|nr:peptidoglycan recognition family protein [Pokkaliibacter plantistimulans]PXF29915.1 hypothetical protein WH50_18365 [Pokkaliibacter plantistimulans]
MLLVDKDGWVNSPTVEKAEYPAIEHGPIGQINAIVLHRTGAPTARSTLAAYSNKTAGAHFLISETGKIYQTASLGQKCWHVGQLRSRCEKAHSCSDEEARKITDILNRKNTGWSKKFTLISRMEAAKPYPLRFPSNNDSIGIEITGTLADSSHRYETPNDLQLKSVYWLLDGLISKYGVTLEDIYAHGPIAHKDENESEGTSTLTAYKVHKGSH